MDRGDYLTAPPKGYTIINGSSSGVSAVMMPAISTETSNREFLNVNILFVSMIPGSTRKIIQEINVLCLHAMNRIAAQRMDSCLRFGRRQRSAKPLDSSLGVTDRLEPPEHSSQLSIHRSQTSLCFRRSPRPQERCVL